MPFEKVEIGEAILHRGDCLEILPTLSKVDAVITDPPYFLPASHYQTRTKFRRTFSDLGILEHWARSFFTELDRIVSLDGSLYIFCDGQSYPLFYWHAYGICKSCRPLIWDKLNSINGYGWRHQHEIILWCERCDAKPLPTGDGDVLRTPPVGIEVRNHPAEKPVELTIALCKKTYGVILDPFMGSGTTGVACMNLGRKFIGVEIEERYFQIACERIEAAQRQQRLFEHEPCSRSETASLPGM
jgi:DNA modification methylase